MIATIGVVLLSGLSGLFMPFVGGISALMHNIPGATLSVANSISAINFAVINQMGSCCICIPIPLAFGVFSLIKRANASALREPLPQPDADL